MKTTPGVFSDLVVPLEPVSEKYNLKGITKSDFILGFLEKLANDKVFRTKLDDFKYEIAIPQTLEKIKRVVENYMFYKIEEENNNSLRFEYFPFSIKNDHEKVDIKFHDVFEIDEITINPWPILENLYEEMCKKSYDFGLHAVKSLERMYLKTMEASDRCYMKPFEDYPEDVHDFLNKNAVDCDCVDNKRIARVEDVDEMRRYVHAQSCGCCGFADLHYKGKDGIDYLVGFNYGH